MTNLKEKSRLFILAIVTEAYRLFDSIKIEISEERAYISISEFNYKRLLLDDLIEQAYSVFNEGTLDIYNEFNKNKDDIFFSVKKVIQDNDFSFVLLIQKGLEK